VVDLVDILQWSMRSLMQRLIADTVVFKDFFNFPMIYFIATVGFITYYGITLFSKGTDQYISISKP
jgi:hypothetical protein